MNAQPPATAARKNAETVIDYLGYGDSPAFLRSTGFDAYPGYAFALRRAVSDCGLRGVYTLRQRTGSSLVPLVYVCAAGDEAQARLIHRRVWNQNIVPFLVVATPWSVRLYPGFRYQQPERTEERDDQALELIEASADA
ncbi:MAG: hypothetical protein M3Z21_06635, partial [Pseudomonadota bacterium]|nr:hypothetical protein [Pseudomonadota bacterium]